MMNGTFLLALGAAWTKVRLSPRLKAAAYWTVLCGAYGNWATTLLAAALGTAAMTLIASAGFGAGRWPEALVTVGFVAVGILILIASVLLLIGFRRQDQEPSA
jgi:(hydroxyamino)benzene mutase